jgi:hypothetical protein
MAGYFYYDATLAASNDAGQVQVASITGDFWAMTGARPALRRLFEPAEPPGAIVLSHKFFERRFGADSHIVGKAMTLDGQPVTIVGVLPPDFQFLFPQDRTDIASIASNEIEAYVPVPPLVRSGGQRTRLFVTAKVKPFGMFVLLIACANIANLLLARAAVRQREIAIRSAIGAGAARVLRQFLAEGLVLALLGGCSGLVLARLVIAMIAGLGSYAVPRLAETTIDARVLTFTLIVSLASGLIFSFGPAISLYRSSPQNALKDGAGSSSLGSGGLRVRRFLVAFELALAMILLTGAGLMMKSFWRMYANRRRTDSAFLWALCRPCGLKSSRAKRGERSPEVPQRLHSRGPGCVMAA